MAKIAVIATGGKQYVVKEGDVLSVERVSGTKGGKVSFDNVLLIDDGSKTQVGTPEVKGATVSAEIIHDGRAPKVTVIHYRAKSRYFKKRGHRQYFSKVKITALP